jgi:peptide/nickel transport system permease protein
MSAPATTITAVTPDGPEVAVAPVKRRRLRFVANPKAATGLAVLAFFCLIAIIGPWVAPYDPSARSSDLIQAPSGKHWFGTTHLGQDIFSQVLVGTRGVMFVGLLAGLVATALSCRGRQSVRAVQRFPGDSGTPADHHRRLDDPLGR